MATNGSQNIVTAATGKVLQGAGIGTAPAFSTATYPSTATGTGKILRADGTNWVASTATYPDTAGTNGNVLVSDGTNWVSSTATSTSFVQFIATSASLASPVDSTTYYLASGPSVPFDQFNSYDVRVQIFCPFACTITKAYGRINVAGTLSTTENCTVFLRLNNTTNTNITTTAKCSSAVNTFNNTGLSIAVAAGDILAWGFTCPAWATNPTQVSMSGSFST